MKVHILILLFFQSFVVSAERLENESIFGWSEKYQAATFIPSLEEKELVIRSSIYHNNGGEKILIIDLTTENSDKNEYTCPNQSTTMSSIGYFNGQAIKLTIKCVFYTDTKEIYLSLTPRTKAGLEYLVAALKKSPNDVSFDYSVPNTFLGKGSGVYNTRISAIGFTKAWREFGSDAL